MDNSGPSSQRDAPRSDLWHQAISALSASMVVYGLTRVVQLGALVILARLLTPDDFGLVAAGTIVVVIGSLTANLGQTSVIIQSPAVSDQTLAAANVLTIASSLLVVALLQWIAPWIADLYQKPALREVVRVLALVCLATGLGAIPSAVLIRNLRARDVLLADLAAILTGFLLVALPLALLGFGYWTLVASAITQGLVRSLLLRIIIKLPVDLKSVRNEAGSLLKRGAPFWGVLILQRMTSEADRLVGSHYLSTRELGLYSKADGLMTFPSAVYAQVAERVAFPAFSQVQADAQRLGSAYVNGLSLTALVSLPMAVVLATIAPELIAFLLGPAWEGTVTPFRILSIVMFFNVSSKVGNTLLMSCGGAHLLIWLQGLFAALMLTACFIGAPLGLNSFALAIALAITLNYSVVTLVASRRLRLGLGVFARAHLHGVVCSVLAAGVVGPTVWAARQAALSDFVILAAVGALLSVVFLIGVLVAPAWLLGPSGQAALRSVLRSLGSPMRGRDRPAAS